MSRKTKPVEPTDIAVHFKPQNQAQAEAAIIARDHDITFLLGPAGTGKTHVAVAVALETVAARFKTRDTSKLIITRPIVEAGEFLGYLPGDLKEKADPFMRPIYDCLEACHAAKPWVEAHVEVSPLAYMRGRTLNRCVAVLDEAQNCTVGQLRLFLTRLGRSGKIIITGDPEQSDIGDDSGLAAVVQALRRDKGIGYYAFSEGDIVRHPLVGVVLKRLKGL